MATPSPAPKPLVALALLSVAALAAGWVRESSTLLGLAALLGALLAGLLVRASVLQARAARGELGAALTRLQAIVDSMADGVIFVDAENRVALVNEAGKALRNLRDGAGKPVKECHPEATHEMLDRVMGWLRDGSDAGPPHSIIKEKDGRWETTYAPVRAPGGAYLGVVMVIRDIAYRRSLERRLLDAERLAAVGQMSAQVAHELRNPLNAITGAAQYLRRVLPGHVDVAEYATLIDDEVRRVNRFVDELLRIARPSSPVLQPCGLNKVAGEAARRVAVARGLPPDGVRVDLARALPPIDADAEIVSEAIVNLLENAFDAGGGPPELATRYEAAGGEGSIVVEVRDRGCGIPPDQLEEVTRPFVTTKARGTGLGLAIVARAMEQHRGGFALEARDGGGTVARLTFPVRTVQRAAPAVEASA